MKYSIEWLIENLERGLEPKYLFFWGHRPSKNGYITSSCLSQWWEEPFLVDNLTYNTAEHWMMAQKALLFKDEAAFNRILKAKTPGEAKAIGREINNFDEIVWEEKRFEVVVNGNLQKFGQNKHLKEFLVNTKERILVEASPVDSIWGIGLATEDERAKEPRNWEGLNLLGFALMEARDILSKN